MDLYFETCALIIICNVLQNKCAVFKYLLAGFCLGIRIIKIKDITNIKYLRDTISCVCFMCQIVLAKQALPGRSNGSALSTNI